MSDNITEVKQNGDKQTKSSVDPFSNIKFANEPVRDSEAELKVGAAVASLKDKGLDVHPRIMNMFLDPDLYRVLAEVTSGDQGMLEEYLDNSSRFNDAVHEARGAIYRRTEQGLLKEEVSVPETRHADGRVRRAEIGRRVAVDSLAG